MMAAARRIVAVLATHIATALRAGVAQPTRIPERVWVTGASSGLGEEVAAAYAARGCLRGNQPVHRVLSDDANAP